MAARRPPPVAIRQAHTRTQQHTAFQLAGVCVACSRAAVDPVFVVGVAAHAAHVAYCRQHIPTTTQKQHIVTPQPSHICPHCSRPSIVNRANPVHHPTSCPNGPVKCPKCEKIHPRHAIDQHHDTCTGPEVVPPAGTRAHDIHVATRALQSLTTDQLRAFVASHPSA